MLFPEPRRRAKVLCDEREALEMGDAKLHAPVQSNALPSQKPAGVRAIAVGNSVEVPRVAHSQPLISTFEPHLLTADTRQEFLVRLRREVHAAATQELAGSNWTAENCPYIEHWFAYYDRRGAGDIEAAIRRYAPGAGDARTPADYLPLVAHRVRLAIKRWRATAEVDAPMTPELRTPAAIEARFPDAEPLISAVRTQMEAAFDVSFANVRVHTSGDGLARAGATPARAVTVGQTIVFGPEQFAPATTTGQLLLAHELAHTQQQTRESDSISSATTDEALADLAAGSAFARIHGLGARRPATRAPQGLSLRRCSMNPVPREFDDEHQYEFQQGHELKQKSWLRQFDRDHGDLKNAVLDPGPRDEGIMTDNGVRIPKVKGHFLQPRSFYNHRFAAFFAYQGAIHYAELIEAGQLSAAQLVANETLDSYGEQVPHDKHLHLESYVHWSFLAKQTSDNLQSSMMVAEGIRGLSELALNRFRAPVVEPQPSRADVSGRPVPNAASGEIDVAAKPEVKPPPISPKHGYPGKWPPPEPGARPPSTASATEMADWRYRRYVYDRFKEGKLPNEVLTPEGYAPHAKTAATPGARPGRGGGEAQKGVREGPAAEAGYQNTETTQLGERWNPKKQRIEKNMVDGYKPNANGGTDYLEVDKINKDGLPHAGYRDKLRTEIDAMKPGDSLEFWDKTDPSRRIRYQYGDSPSVVDTRKAETVTE